MIDQELLKACTINSWSVTPRMMLVDSMIEAGYSEFKALEAFEPPTASKHLPLTYSISNGRGGGYGNSVDYGTGGGYGHGGDIGYGYGSGSGYGYGISYGSGCGCGDVNGHGNGSGWYDGGVLQTWDNND